MFGLNSLFCYNSYNRPLWTIMDHNGVVLAIMEKSIFPDAISLSYYYNSSLMLLQLSCYVIQLLPHSAIAAHLVMLLQLPSHAYCSSLIILLQHPLMLLQFHFILLQLLCHIIATLLSCYCNTSVILLQLPCHVIAIPPSYYCISPSYYFNSPVMLLQPLLYAIATPSVMLLQFLCHTIATPLPLQFPCH